ncbi:MAG: S16 family serine protease [Microcoleaceae cyanobacterium]
MAMNKAITWMFWILVGIITFVELGYILASDAKAVTGREISQPLLITNIFPLQTRRVTSEADVMLYLKTNPPSGSLGRAFIEVEQGHSHNLKVGFFESRLGNTGDQWRSAAWSSIVTSSFLLGRDFNHYRFSFDFNGSVDGPSAGGLFTVHVLALALGDTVRSDTTMTGTINPDGTIGPVGGISAKLRGAANAGKNRIAIPVGSLTPEVVEAQKETGLTVTEVANIFDAYRFLTNRELPHPIGDSDERPRLTPDDHALVVRQIEALHQQYQARGQVKAVINDDFPELLRELVEQGRMLAKESDTASQKALRKEDLPTAYEHGLTANWLFEVTQHLIQLAPDVVASSTYETNANKDSLDEDMQKNDTQSILDISSPAAIRTTLYKLRQRSKDQWNAFDVRSETLLNRLKKINPKTADEAVTLIRAYGHWIAAQGIKANTEETVASSDDLKQVIFYTAISPAIANRQLQMLEDTLELGLNSNTRIRFNVQQIDRFGNILFQGANASLKAFESLTLQPYAKAKALAIDEARKDFNMVDWNYFLAQGALDIIPSLTETIDSPEQNIYARLGGSLLSYQQASLLIAKYYSLNAKFDPELESLGLRVPVSFEKEVGLNNMLDLAEQKSRQSIALARHIGGEPKAQILDYGRAKFLREGDASDKLKALTTLWEVRIESELMAIFSDQFALEKRPPTGIQTLKWGAIALVIILVFGGLIYRKKIISSLD